MNQVYNRHAYRILLGLAACTLAIGTVFYHAVEHLRWLDAYYLSVVTLATVGYGDFSPKTDLGKVFTTFYIFVGVGILTAFLSYTFRRRAMKIEQRHQEKESKNR